MVSAIKAIIALIAGSALGWWLLAGFCGIPGLKFSIACGHNAYIWIPIFVPLSVYASWLTLDFISRKIQKRTANANDTNKNA